MQAEKDKCQKSSIWESAGEREGERERERARRRMSGVPSVQAFHDNTTGTNQFVVWDPESKLCAIVGVWCFSLFFSDEGILRHEERERAREKGM